MILDKPIIFTYATIGKLRGLYGVRWNALIDTVLAAPEDHECVVAFIIMMSKLNDCVKCHPHSERIQAGCKQCSIARLARVRDEDKVLSVYADALAQVRAFQNFDDDAQCETA